MACTTHCTVHIYSILPDVKVADGFFEQYGRMLKVHSYHPLEIKSYYCFVEISQSSRFSQSMHSISPCPIFQFYPVFQLLVFLFSPAYSRSGWDTQILPCASKSPSSANASRNLASLRVSTPVDCICISFSKFLKTRLRVYIHTAIHTPSDNEPVSLSVSRNFCGITTRPFASMVLNVAPVNNHYAPFRCTWRTFVILMPLIDTNHHKFPVMHIIHHLK